MDDVVRLPQKPLLRGHLHQSAFFAALGACALLVAKGNDTPERIATLVYSAGLLALFGISALYHRPMWPEKPRALLKRLDHSAIFVFIAGSTTPLSLLALAPDQGRSYLFLMWGVALAGVLQANLWVRAPRYLTASFYVGMGWLSLTCVNDLSVAIGPTSMALFAGGGLIYTIGAVCYALKRPRLSPRIFGYHEAFHLLTVIAAACHFIVIYRLVD